MAADEPLRYRRLRAPAEDQTALIEPPLAEVPRVVAANQAKSREWDRLSGLPFSIWRGQARSKPLRQNDERDLPHKPIVLSGHQPTLFHPGVWFKTFVLARIAEEVSGDGFDLVIDNDTIRGASIRVPVGSSIDPRVVEIPFDAPSDEVPWEERRILDRRVFDSFASHVVDAFRPQQNEAVLPSQRLVLESMWEHAREVVAVMSDSPTLLPLGFALAWARHRLERSHGLQVKSHLLSELSGPGAFSQLVDTILGRAREFRGVYNACLAEYRSVNHIRSKSHPVSDLLEEGDWLEMPFWIWTAAQPQRRRAFVRSRESGWEIRDGANVVTREQAFFYAIDISPSIKIRPRALITTMYARLVLSDLFIHGIGGAKYDEVTDAIIRRFFGIEPPAFVTASATVRLPLERPQVMPEDLAALDQKYRDTIHHPEEFLDDYSGHHRAEFASLVKQKLELVAHRWNEKQKRVWHDQVARANERMSSLLEPLREQLRHDREQILADLHRLRILGSREYSFCLFPEAMLVPLLKRMAGIQS